MQFDPRYQQSKDGPLSKELRKRLNAFRELGFTLKDIGDRLGFSGPFISQLLNEKTPARIRSIHIPKVVQAIEHAEIENGLRNAVPKIGAAKRQIDDLSLEELMNAISAKGFEVSVKPKAV